MDANFVLEQFSLEELLEMLDITPTEVLRILIEGGHVQELPWMEGYFGS